VPLSRTNIPTRSVPSSRPASQQGACLQELYEKIFTVTRAASNQIDKFSNLAGTLELTRFIRGILLKGNGIANIGSELWPIALFVVVAMFIAMKRYRQTLD